MLNIDKIMRIADELGIKIRNDREPGVYDSEGNFESYESAMEGFIEKVTIDKDYSDIAVSEANLKNDYRKSSDFDSLRRNIEFNSSDPFQITPNMQLAS